MDCCRKEEKSGTQTGKKEWLKILPLAFFVVLALVATTRLLPRTALSLVGQDRAGVSMCSILDLSTSGSSQDLTGEDLDQLLDQLEGTRVRFAAPKPEIPKDTGAHQLYFTCDNGKTPTLIYYDNGYFCQGNSYYRVLEDEG